MMRKMASVRKIDKIREHTNADTLELAILGGWQVVVKKGEFQAGDLCVYCEIDSIMRERPEFEFLASCKYRIKTVKLRKELSQGICFPLSILPEGDYAEGDDVTEILGVTKHEPPVSTQLAGQARGNFPSLVVKTDEPRIQNLGQDFEQIRTLRLVKTEKLEGASLSLGRLDDGDFHVCSRNIDLKETDENAYWKAVRQLDLEEKMQRLSDIVLQGELVGASIQGNIYKLSRLDIYVFGGFNWKEQRYLSWPELSELCGERDIKMVPLLDDNFIIGDRTTQDILDMADGQSKLHPTKREGIVFRSYGLIKDVPYGKISFKAVSNKFLLKHGD